MGTVTSLASRAATSHSGQKLLASPEFHNHIVQFYDGEAHLARVVTDFLAAGLTNGNEPEVVIATEAHRDAFRSGLTHRGFDADAVCASGQLTFLDARATLETFMIAGMPDWNLFLQHVGGVLEQLGRRAQGGRIRAYGEMVDLLWREGNRSAAIRLEEFWNDIAKVHPFCLLCAYLMGNFYKDGDRDQFVHVCRAHSHVLPTETYVDADDPAERLRQVGLLQQRALALETELRDREQLEQALRVALEGRRRSEEALRQSQQELQDFVENAAEGMHWVGADGRILWANQAELDLLGYSKDEYLGHHISEFHADPPIIADILSRLGRNETLHGYEARLMTKNGSIKHVLITSNVYQRNGEFIHTRCFTRDISDRKRVEDEVRLRYEFEQQLIGIVSHDLRNPLNAITMSAALARVRTNDERTTKALVRINASAERATHIIADLLDLTQARLGGGIPIQVKPTSVDDIAQDVLEEHRAAHPERELLLMTEGNTRGKWDPERLGQALSNLVSNAIQYSPPETTIIVRAEGRNETVVASVHNQGAPISQQLLCNIFQPFNRGQFKRTSKSLGLGLYIVERIVSAHGGTVQCRSTASEGTTFQFIVPRHPPAPIDEPSKPASVYAAAR